MSEHCEPPEELTGQDRWYWLEHEYLGHQRPSWWNGKLAGWLEQASGQTHSPMLMSGWGWRYLEPVLTPAEAAASAAENARLTKENDTLRGLLAKGDKDCPYCGLSSADIAKCGSGFPGCARMDDIMQAPESKAETENARLREALERVKDVIENDPDNVNTETVVDTVWNTGIETLVDYISAALAGAAP